MPPKFARQGASKYVLFLGNGRLRYQTKELAQYLFFFTVSLVRGDPILPLAYTHTVALQANS